MNKVSYILVALIAVFLFSCKEQIPPGLDLGGTSNATDSSYLASIETPQQKNVLIEEVTGVTCTNCPDGAILLKSIIAQNSGKGVMVGIHGTLFAIPYNENKYDFRTTKGEEIINSLGQPALPAAAIDRIADGLGVFYRSKSEWSNIFSSEVVKSTPVNIHLTGTYNVDSNNYELIAKVAFTQDYANKLNLTVYVIEDGLIDYQLDKQVKIPNYKHDHVFRDCITNIAGTPLNFADKKAGRILQKKINFKPSIDNGANSWNLDNCHIVAYVSNPDTKEVLHVEEIKMK